MRTKILSSAVALCLFSAGTGFTVGNLTTSHKDCVDTIDKQEITIRALEMDIQTLMDKINELQKQCETETDEFECILYSALPLSAELQQYTYSMCVDNGIEPHYELILAMMWQESNFNPAAISKTGDYGIMQINKCNHNSLSNKLGINNFLDAKQNIKAGVYMISGLLKKYDETHALMAYNMGETGAANARAAGTYSTQYSRNILEKKNKIIANTYN